MSKKQAKPKKGFLDGYKTYKGRHGSPDEWKSTFRQAMSLDEANEILEGEDPLNLFELSYGATMDEIKKAYRAAAMKYHPDRNPNKKEWAEKMFKKCHAAYVKLGGRA